MDPIFCLMTLNSVKLGRTVTFVKHFASAVSLMFLQKTLSGTKSRYWQQIC